GVCSPWAGGAGCAATTPLPRRCWPRQWTARATPPPRQTTSNPWSRPSCWPRPATGWRASGCGWASRRRCRGSKRSCVSWAARPRRRRGLSVCCGGPAGAAPPRRGGKWGVRTNKRVIACEEGPLLEARVLLRRGELGPAEKALREAAPFSGPLRVEQYLLLAWVRAGQRKHEQAAEAFRQAEQGPYPRAALD